MGRQFASNGVSEEINSLSNIDDKDENSLINFVPTPSLMSHYSELTTLNLDQSPQSWGLNTVPLDDVIPNPPGAFSLIRLIQGITYDENAALSGGVIPPDPHGAVGPDHVVSVVNRSIEFHTKSGTQQLSQSLQSFFGSALNPFDPKVIYDQHSGRFVVVALEVAGRNSGTSADDQSRILVAVSDDSNPNGTWYKTTIDARTALGGGSSWADYPGIAVDKDAVYITNNMFTFEGDAYQGSRVWIIPKGLSSNGFYAGGTAVVNAYATGANTTLMPALVYGDVAGSADMFLVGMGGTNGTDEFATIVRIDNAISSPTFTSQSLNLGNIYSNSTVPGAPQLGGTTTLDAGQTRVFDAVWRSNGLYFVTTINGISGNDAGEGTAYWAQVNTTNLASLALTQSGTIGGDSIGGVDTHTFYPSIAVNADGDIGVGFSASSPTIYAGAYFAWRDVADPLGTMRTPLLVKAGEDFYVRTFGAGRNRWGDYTSTEVDPSDDQSFWVFNEYAMARSAATSDNGRWSTVWGFFSGAGPTEGRTIYSALLMPTSSTDLVVTIRFPAAPATTL